MRGIGHYSQFFSNCAANLELTKVSKLNFLFFYRLNLKTINMAAIDILLPKPEMLLKIFGHLEYRDIVSVGRTCKQWHRLSQDEYLLLKIKDRDFTSETWPHRNDTLVPYLCITSGGRCTSFMHGEIFGFYALVSGSRPGGRPVYQQMGSGYGGTKIWYDSKKKLWTVSNWQQITYNKKTRKYEVKLEKKYRRIVLRAKKTTSNPTNATWKVQEYSDDYHGRVTGSGQFFSDDVKVAALVKLPPACTVTISCAALPRHGWIFIQKILIFPHFCDKALFQNSLYFLIFTILRQKLL